MSALWKILNIGVILVALLGIGLYFHERPASFSQAISHLPFSAPCARPLSYTIGTIDPRFNLSKFEIEQDLRTSAKLWNDAAGKTVLAYEPADPNAMPVNFVYDARQQTVVLGSAIDSTEASQTTARAQIQRLQSTYLAAQQAYASAVALFNSRSQAYADEVDRVNGEGGADPATYERLNSKKNALKEQQAALDAQGNALEAQGAVLKQKVDAFNTGVRDINKVVNTFNSTVGGDFEEGQYVREASGAQHVDIYAYKDRTELVHSLTHEFGHALGLGHNSNTASIMFPYNKSSLAFSPEDRADLKAACKL
jgi:hypothetical protein